MYRDILTKPIELTECVIILRCPKCGREICKPEKCPMTGKSHGQGYEYTCKTCRATMVEVKNAKRI